jgi:hypothetical protein
MLPSNLRQDQSKFDWDQLNRSGNREKVVGPSSKCFVTHIGDANNPKASNKVSSLLATWKAHQPVRKTFFLENFTCAAKKICRAWGSFFVVIFICLLGDGEAAATPSE